ncbi:MAG: hypothetical protein ACJAXW_003998, partial [Candidatus Azotimanducaceae bacterium]
SANELVLEYEGNQSIENSNTSSAETVNTGAVSTGPTKKMLAIVAVIISRSVLGYWVVLLN